MHEILTGESVRPAEQYTSTTTPEGRGRDATVDPAPSGQGVEGDGSEGAKTATEAGKEGTPGTPAVVSSGAQHVVCCASTQPRKDTKPMDGRRGLR